MCHAGPGMRRELPAREGTEASGMCEPEETTSCHLRGKSGAVTEDEGSYCRVKLAKRRIAFPAAPLLKVLVDSPSLNAP